MRLLTGDECGLIKETIPEEGRPTVLNTGPTNATTHPITVNKGIRRVDDSIQRRARGVLGMTWTKEESAQFAALRADGTIELWEATYEDDIKKPGEYLVEETIDNVFEKSEGRPLRSLFYSKERLCAADSLGNIAVVNPNKTSVVASYSAFNSSKQGDKISYTKGQYSNTQIATTMTASAGGRIAIAGRERETTIIDINGGAQLWKAKNLPPDPQTLLQQPVWSTALTFLTEDLLLAGTAYKQVRLYDIRSNSRRPASYTPEDLLEHRVTALCGIDDNRFVVGDAAGTLNEVDVRMVMAKKKKSTIKSLPRYVGPAGSIRQIVRHPTKPILACVGLDRMLRTYRTTSRTQLDCVYMKQRLNCILFCDDEEWGDEIISDHDIDAEDEVEDYVDSDEDSDQATGEDESGSEEDSDDDDDDDDDDDGEGQSDSDESEDEEVDIDDSDESGDDGDPFAGRSGKKQRR